MKVTAVIGSPSRDGNNAILARRALDGARDAGAEVEEIHLADKRVEFCRGCFACMSAGRCPIGDDFEELKAKVYASGGIVLASPVYGLGLTARMKNFWVDRMGMFSVYTSRLAGKYFLGLSTGGVMGAAKVARAYRLGAKLAGDIAIGRRYPFQSFAKAAGMRLFLSPLMIRNIRRDKEGFLKPVYGDLASRGLMA